MRPRRAAGRYDQGSQAEKSNETPQRTSQRKQTPAPAARKTPATRGRKAAASATAEAASIDESNTIQNSSTSKSDLSEKTLQAILDRLSAMNDRQEALEKRQEDFENSSKRKRDAAESTHQPDDGKSSKKTKSINQAVDDSSDESEKEDGEVDGEENEVSDDDELQEGNIFIPLEDMVDDAVSKKNEKKILANKFVEFSELLPDEEEPEEEEYTMNVSHKSKGAVFTRRKNKKNLPFHLWLQAFGIFSTIYQGRARSAVEAQAMARELATYSRNVTELRAKGYKWCAFDRAFRKRQSRRLGSWAHLPQGLMLKYQAQPFRKEPAENRAGKKRTFNKFRSDIPKGHCFAYHSKEQYCSLDSCKYKHTCPYCNEEHPLYRCKNKSGKGPYQERRQQGGPRQGGQGNSRGHPGNRGQADNKP